MRFPNCSAALEALAKGLDEKTCHDFRAIRQVVMCDAWHEKRTEPFTPETFHQRIEESWKQTEAKCSTHGGTKPEVGFLQSGERITNYIPPGSLGRVTGVQEIRRKGIHAGVIIHEDNGTVSVCLDNNCGSITRGADLAENVTAILETAGYEVSD